MDEELADRLANEITSKLSTYSLDGTKLECLDSIPGYSLPTREKILDAIERVHPSPSFMNSYLPEYPKPDSLTLTKVLPEGSPTSVFFVYIFNVYQEQKTRLGKTLGVMLSTFQNDVPYLVGYVGIYNLKDNQLEHYRSIYERVDLGNTYDWDIDYLLLKISKRIPPEYMSSDDTLQDGAKNPH